MVPAAAAASAFKVYGLPHLTVLALVPLTAGLLILRARRHPDRVRSQNWALAVFMLALFPIALALGWTQGWLTLENAMPCQLCDVTAACAAVALITRRQRWAEIAWFWGIAGTLNGLLTPTVTDEFPAPAFFLFFALHGGVVISAFYLVFGLRLKPERGAVWRVLGWAQVYFVVASLVNFIAGTNYGYLRAKPPQASLLDVLGPWPWYLLALEGVAVIFFNLLYLPFIRCRKPE
ncbi:MAG: TIGR02206 family membrane protein [Verrucomicrobiota bacterium]